MAPVAAEPVPGQSPPIRPRHELAHELCDGKLIALLCNRQSRVRLNTCDIWAADRRFFQDALVSLLEAAA